MPQLCRSPKLASLCSALALSLLLGACNVKVPSQANGIGYGGGDLIFARTAEVATALDRALKFVENNRPKLCRVPVPETDIPAPLLSRLKSLTAAQADFCELFLHQNAASLRALLQQSPQQLFEFTEEDLQVTEGGQQVTVVARTPLGPQGKITLNRRLVGNLSTLELAALIAHELGHKISYNGGFLEDTQGVGAFPNQDGSRTLLDSVGSALAVLAFPRTGAFPELTPTGGIILTNVNGSRKALSSVYDHGRADSKTYFATKTITNAVPVVLYLSGQVVATHIAQDGAISGVIANLSIDGVTCAVDNIFQTNTPQINYHVNVNCIQTLQPGTHTLKVVDASFGSYPGMQAYSATLSYKALVAPEASPASPIQLVEKVTSYGSTVSRTFTNTVPVVLEAAGHTRRTLTGATPNYGGVHATLTVDGVVCASDFSFDVGSRDIAFYASSSCLRVLQPGTHTVTLTDSTADLYSDRMIDPYTELQFTTTALAGGEADTTAGILAGEQTTSSAMPTIYLTVTSPVVLTVAGYLSGDVVAGSGPGGGVFAGVYVNGDYCAGDFQFDAHAGAITYQASAVCTIALPAGTHVLRAGDPVGYAKVTGRLARLQYSVAAAAP